MAALVSAHSEASFRITIASGSRIHELWIDSKERSAQDATVKKQRVELQDHLKKLSNQLDRESIAQALLLSRSELIGLTHSLDCLTGMSEHRYPFDVCFEFSGSGKALWDDSARLKIKSPYWLTLLEGGFSEGTKKRKAVGGEPRDSTECCDHPCFIINVQEEDGEDLYEAYKQVLAWTRAGTIVFGPIATSTPPPPPPPPSRNPSEVPGPPDVVPAVAQPTILDSYRVPIDPVTIFEIAKFNRLDRLPARALKDVKQKLTVDNVLDQIFSSTLAWQHLDLKDCLLRFCAEERNRNDPKLLREFAIIKDRIEADELPIPGRIGGSLAMDLIIKMSARA
ncbi:BQ2448_4377 [Microbotryum intermedium]|uniref:BQ2448_4377 protein n=1 Tax=Microbotryum intermedium TaxID=269621 RepID=A0A238FG98_9BASI|nr:BQ2448_4377 [Microbotryum intermedium]